MKRTTQKMYAVLLTFVMLCGCLIIPTPATVEAAGNTKLKVTSAKTVVVGKTIKIKTNVKAKFKSSNKKIATVSSKGVVKGKKAGKVKITVTSKSNKKQKKVIKITVKKKQNTTATTEKQTPSPNPKPTTEAPSTKPTTQAPTTQAPTTEKKTTQEATTKKGTTEKTTTEAPKLVGITAKYRGEKVPNGSEITRYGIDMVGVYNDGSNKTINLDYSTDNKIKLNTVPKTETTSDGKVYNTYTVSYENFSTEFTVEVVDVKDFVYPTGIFITFKDDAIIGKGQKPTDKDINEAYIFLSDGSEKVIEDTSLITYLLYYDVAVEGRNEYEFSIIYDCWITYNNEKFYINFRDVSLCGYE